jgi:hypothetical protein
MHYIRGISARQQITISATTKTGERNVGACPTAAASHKEVDHRARSLGKPEQLEDPWAHWTCSSVACAGSVAFLAGLSGVVDESWAALRGIRLGWSRRHRSHYQDLAQVRSSKPAETRLVSHEDAMI